MIFATNAFLVPECPRVWPLLQVCGHAGDGRREGRVSGARTHDFRHTPPAGGPRLPGGEDCTSPQSAVSHHCRSIICVCLTCRAPCLMHGRRSATTLLGRRVLGTTLCLSYGLSECIPGRCLYWRVAHRPISCLQKKRGNTIQQSPAAQSCSPVGAACCSPGILSHAATPLSSLV